jgi:hypothetical protein
MASFEIIVCNSTAPWITLGRCRSLAIGRLNSVAKSPASPVAGKHIQGFNDGSMGILRLFPSDSRFQFSLPLRSTAHPFHHSCHFLFNKSNAIPTRRAFGIRFQYPLRYKTRPDL